MTAEDKRKEMEKLDFIFKLIKSEFKNNYVYYNQSLIIETINYIESLGYKVEFIPAEIHCFRKYIITNNAYKISWQSE